MLDIFSQISIREELIMENLTKRDIVVRIAKETGLIQQDVMKVVQKTLDYIADAVVEGRNVELRNFGVFELRVRKPRVGRNPNRPEIDVPIPEQPVVKFKVGKELKKRVTEAYHARKNGTFPQKTQNLDQNSVEIKNSASSNPAFTGELF